MIQVNSRVLLHPEGDWEWLLFLIVPLWTHSRRNWLASLYTRSNDSFYLQIPWGKVRGKHTSLPYWFVPILKSWEMLVKKTRQGKGTKPTVPQTTVLFHWKSQHHEAHTHPHQTPLFPSVHKALGGGVKRRFAALEKGTQNEAEQEVTLDRSCFLSRLIVLSGSTWAKVSQICIYKLFHIKHQV